MSEEKEVARPAELAPTGEPWDSGRTMAPDPSWPIEWRLHWHEVCGHILLLNCSEVTRRKAAAAADREAQRATVATQPSRKSQIQADAARRIREALA